VHETLVWTFFAHHFFAPSCCALAFAVFRGTGSLTAACAGRRATAGANPVPRRLAAAFTSSPLRRKTRAAPLY